MTAPEHIAVCIATYRRPQGLARLLASLDALTFARASPRLTLIVVDNDTNGGGHAIASAWRGPHAIHAVTEPARGLANVRNRALAEVPGDVTSIAFIDDDEWAEPQWLDALLAVRNETGAGIVQGPVIPSFPVDAPAWLAPSGYLEVGPFRAGEELDFGASGNCLLSPAMLVRTGIRFDPAFNLSGGEDADFFDRLLRAGERIVAAPDARVWEHVPPERMTPAAIGRLFFRKGNTHGFLARRSGSATAVAVRFVKAIGWIGYGLAQIALIGPFREDVRVHGRAKIARGLGTLAAFLSIRSRYYADGKAS
jgi:GT2 family glycosyltransferase